MNIAFPALIIFLIIFPGFIFRKAYYLQEDNYTDYTPFATKTINAILTSIVFNCIWLALSYLTSYRVDFTALLALLTGQNGVLFQVIVTNISKNITGIFIYFLSMFAVAWFSGILLRILVAKYKLDLKYSFLKINNPWFYIFKGYTHPDKMKIIGSIIVATVATGDVNYLYIGILSAFDLDAQGNLKTVRLTKPYRRELTKDKEGKICETCQPRDFEERFYKIDGDYLILEYSNITSFNIAFVKIEKVNKF